MDDRPVQTALAARDLPVAARAPERWLGAAASGALGFRLDSAAPHPRTGRFSFAGADPYAVLRLQGRRIGIEQCRAVHPTLSAVGAEVRGDPVSGLRALLPAPPDLGAECESIWPFVGGAVGYFGYEWASALEPRLPRAPADTAPYALPDAMLLLVDAVLAVDLESDHARLFALGFHADPGEAEARAQQRLDAFERDLRVRAEQGAVAASPEHHASAPVSPPAMEAIAAAALPAELCATEDAGSYAKAVEAVREEIAAGNVYQANFTQRLSTPCGADVWSVYDALRRINPAPFAAALDLPEAAIVSSSPERFLRVDGAGRVETRPIKGTRPRGRELEADGALEAALAHSPKDRAENLMIVDLMRNDLGRTCEIGSVTVPELMVVEAYASVFQLVSSVEGRLAPGRDALDALAAAFPPGSMTGAPKRAAIELLARLEREPRGVYSGALGHLDVRGGLDLAVVIRTLILQDGIAHLNVGGGVVADSSPAAEYEEALDKARALLVALAELGEA